MDMDTIKRFWEKMEKGKDRRGGDKKDQQGRDEGGRRERGQHGGMKRNVGSRRANVH